MAEISPRKQRQPRFLILLAGLLSVILLSACVTVQPNTPASTTGAPTTSPPSATPAPATPSPTVTRTALPTPSPTATTHLTHTPFPRDLAYYFLTYDPNARPDLPPSSYSISMWNIWHDSIPVTPVDVTPQFSSYPAPSDLATHAQELFLQTGCKEGEYLVECEQTSPLYAFGCQWWAGDMFALTFPMMADISFVARCPTSVEYDEKEPQDLYISGCAFRMKAGYIIKIKDDYVLVNTFEQMKALFVPIESPTQALSYAEMMTGLDPRFELAYDPDLLYLQSSIEGTHVTESDGSYQMNLYHSQVCGCEPWMTSQVIVQVDRDGTITYLSAIPVYFTTGYSCAD